MFCVVCFVVVAVVIAVSQQSGAVGYESRGLFLATAVIFFFFFGSRCHFSFVIILLFASPWTPVLDDRRYLDKNSKKRETYRKRLEGCVQKDIHTSGSKVEPEGREMKRKRV